jgi:hypothetical protein
MIERLGIMVEKRTLTLGKLYSFSKNFSLTIELSMDKVLQVDKYLKEMNCKLESLKPE